MTSTKRVILVAPVIITDTTKNTKSGCVVDTITVTLTTATLHHMSAYDAVNLSDYAQNISIRSIHLKGFCSGEKSVGVVFVRILLLNNHE
jgi:hypothetical protein